MDLNIDGVYGFQCLQPSPHALNMSDARHWHEVDTSQMSAQIMKFSKARRYTT